MPGIAGIVAIVVASFLSIVTLVLFYFAFGLSTEVHSPTATGESAGSPGDSEAAAA